MGADTMAAAICVPAALGVPLAIAGLVLFGLLLSGVFFQKLGRKGTLIFAGVIALFLVITLILGAMRSSRRHEAAAREQALIDLVVERIEKLEQSKVGLEQGCSGAPPIKLEEILLGFRPRGELITIAYRPYKDGMYGDDEHSFAYGGSFTNHWLTALNPFGWGGLFAEDKSNRLSHMRYVLAVGGDQASLVELGSEKVICSGKLAASFNGERSGGYDDMEPIFAKPMTALCKQLGNDACAAMVKTAGGATVTPAVSG